MKTTRKSRVLLSASIGVGFSAVMFLDPILFAVLAVLLGIMLAEAILLFIATRRALSRFSISNVSLEQRPIYPGEEISGKFRFENKWRGLVSISSDSDFLNFTPNSLRGERSKSIDFSFKTPFAGNYAIRKLDLTLVTPLGLFSGNCSIPIELKFSVFPRVMQLVGVSTRLLGKSGIGETPVELPGIGTEFYEMREYQVGDDYRNINWKASARRGEIVVIERMKEVGGSYYLVLDARASGYFERDRLASTFLQIANTLTMSRSKFGVIVHDGEKITSIRRIGVPEDSLGLALKVALDFAFVNVNSLPEELSGVASQAMKISEKLASSSGLVVLSEIENAGRMNLKNEIGSSDLFLNIMSLVRESGEERPTVLYVTSEKNTSQFIEFGTLLRQILGVDYVLVDPSMPWVVEPNEEEAYSSYERFASRLKSLAASRIEYAVGEPRTIAQEVL